MNFFAKIVVFLFFIFLSVPSILSVIEGKAKIAFSIDIDEEENQKEIKFFTANVLIEKFNFSIFSKRSIPLIVFENKFKHDNFFSFIFSPPPNS